MTSNNDNFIKNLDQCSIHTRCNKDLYLPRVNIAINQKGVHYSGVKIFNNIPSDNKTASGNTTRFKNLLKHFLSTHTFYSLEEFYNR